MGYATLWKELKRQPGQAKAATNCVSLHSSKQVVQGQSLAASNIGLNQRPTQEASKPTHSVTSFRQHHSRIQLAIQATYPKGDLSNHQTMLRQISLFVVSTFIVAPTLWYGSVLTANSLRDSHTNRPIATKNKLQQEAPYNPYMRHSWNIQLR